MTDEVDNRLRELRERLQSTNGRFEQELRARGFDPAQVETAALPSGLAKLYLERRLLLDELSEMTTPNRKRQKHMTEVERILDQYRRSFDGQAWHGPSVLATLKDVTAAQAAARPIPSAHSIWELVLHIGAWERACRRRLMGDPAQLTDQEDWPVVTDTSDEAWQSIQHELSEIHQQLLDSVAAVDESRLDQPIIADSAAEYSSVYVTLHGVIQHDLYHAGQIAILKKAMIQNRER
jgi:uncharacterized damage-inducible protein DinB